MKYIKSAIKNSFNIKGRARRAEFAAYMFFALSIIIVTSFYAGMSGNILFAIVPSILFSIPMPSLFIRRIHDVKVNKYLAYIPFVKFYYFAAATDPETNQFGPPAKTPEDSTVLTKIADHWAIKTSTVMFFVTTTFIIPMTIFTVSMVRIYDAKVRIDDARVKIEQTKAKIAKIQAELDAMENQ